jgi:AcrR family transcriptional regulator
LQNRSELLTAARRLFQKEGVTPSFNALAAEVGMGVGTVYRHFEDSRALLYALAEEQLDALQSLMQLALDHPEPLEAVERAFHGALLLQLENRALTELLVSPHPAPDYIRTKVTALEAAMERLLARAKRKKLIRADITADDIRRLTCGLELAARSGEAPHKAAQRYAALTFRGLKREPGST